MRCSPRLGKDLLCAPKVNSCDITTLLTSCLGMAGAYLTESSNASTWRMLPPLRRQMNWKK